MGSQETREETVVVIQKHQIHIPDCLLDSQ